MGNRARIWSDSRTNWALDAYRMIELLCGPADYTCHSPRAKTGSVWTKTTIVHEGAAVIE